MFSPSCSLGSIGMIHSTAECLKNISRPIGRTAALLEPGQVNLNPSTLPILFMWWLGITTTVACGVDVRLLYTSHSSMLNGCMQCFTSIAATVPLFISVGRATDFCLTQSCPKAACIQIRWDVHPDCVVYITAVCGVRTISGIYFRDTSPPTETRLCGFEPPVHLRYIWVEQTAR